MDTTPHNQPLRIAPVACRRLPRLRDWIVRPLMRMCSIIFLTALAAVGCNRESSSPTRASGSTEQTFQRDFHTALNLYRDAGDAQSAKVALQAWEKVLAHYEKAGTRHIQLDYHQMVLYGRLYAVHTALGDTNAAAQCRAEIGKLTLAEATPGAQLVGDLQPFFDSVEKIDRNNGVRWRQAK